MKKFIISLLIISSYLFGKAQTKQYDVGNLNFETFISDNFCKRFYSEKELPPLVNKLISSQVKAKTGRHYKNFTFNYCDIIEVEKFLQDYPDSLNHNFLPIPRYRVVFNWCDSTLGVKSYLFQALMDQYGQFIYLGFPRTNFDTYNKTNNLFTFDEAIQLADSIVSTDSVKYDSRERFLYYDLLNNDLKWFFTYIKRKHRIIEQKTFDLYRVITFSMKEGKLISDVTEESEYIYFQF